VTGKGKDGVLVATLYAGDVITAAGCGRQSPGQQRVLRAASFPTKAGEIGVYDEEPKCSKTFHRLDQRKFLGLEPPFSNRYRCL